MPYVANMATHSVLEEVLKSVITGSLFTAAVYTGYLPFEQPAKYMIARCKENQCNALENAIAEVYVEFAYITKTILNPNSAATGHKEIAPTEGLKLCPYLLYNQLIDDFQPIITLFADFLNHIPAPVVEYTFEPLLPPKD